MLEFDARFIVEVAAFALHARTWTFWPVGLAQETIEPLLPLRAVLESELRWYSVCMHRSSALP